MKFLHSAIREEHEYQALLDHCLAQYKVRKPNPVLVTGLSEGTAESFYGAFLTDLRKQFPAVPALCILPDEKAILQLSTVLSESGLQVLTYPLRDFQFHNFTASRDFEHERLSVLCAILSNTADVILTTPDAALQYTIPREVLLSERRLVSMDEPCDMEQLTAMLTESGYVRVDTVDSMGQFAVRGGILDVFPAQGENPVRMEFFGDEIDSMGYFDAMTQRRIESCHDLLLPPAKEVLLTEVKRAELRDLISVQMKKCKNSAGRDQLAGELEVLNSGTEPLFLDKYISFLYPERESLLDYFKADTGSGRRAVTPVLCENSPSIGERLTAYEFNMRETITALLEEGGVPAKYAEYSGWKTDYENFVSSTACVFCNTFAQGLSVKLSGLFTFRSRQLPSYSDSYETLREELVHYREGGFRTVIETESKNAAASLQQMLFDDGITSTVPTEPEPEFSSLVPGVPVILTTTEPVTGFELTESRFVLLSMCAGTQTLYARAVSKRSHKSKKKKSAQETILSYADLTVGDYVVHVNHGIGIYRGMETMQTPVSPTEKITRDYLRIEFAEGAMLYLPCDRLDAISKYIGAGAEEGLVKLSKMGGGEWNKTKSKVKSAAKEMAKELITLYAARMRKPGFAFSADDDMQRGFEDAFPYEETDCQLRAAEEIKADMMRPTPMDRLLCGDVGYGKTEVALRAAMKAVENGKQVAVLVPTTILAMQHYQTILSRFRGLPVTVEVLSRFRTDKQQDLIIRRLKRGDIDIVVGTHRLVSKDISFKDLGLVIIDEEQRFGVAQKERLKSISGNVDCLTLTATPIPRTLNMAMSGIRDISLLDEAPGDRVPIQTYVLEYDEAVLGEAVKKELRRGGQVFWLHNRVEDIDSTLAKVSAMAPEAVIRVAHGRMEKEEISAIWQELLEGQIDILVSTTIIETGIDIPNANTLIIENADRMGLSQLHQIRGRIGRSSRRAYAYFTYPKDKVLTEISSKRLQAIREYTELGSGFKIAMRDLEIRGAGDILGAEQHGQMNSVGYDLYMKLLNEAILEERGESGKKKTEAVVDFDVDAYLPEQYVKSSALRIEMYKKIAAVETEDDAGDVLDELTDRFGTPPKTALNLLHISRLRALASECGIQKVTAKGGREVLFYPENFQAQIWVSAGRILNPAGTASQVVSRVSTVNGKNTPYARAAALVRAASQAKAQGKETASSGSEKPIRLTVKGGNTPCVSASIGRQSEAIDTAEKVLTTYRKLMTGSETIEIGK